MQIANMYLFVVGVILVALIVSMVIGYAASAAHYAIRKVIRKNLRERDFHLVNLGLLGLLFGVLTAVAAFLVIAFSFDPTFSPTGATIMFIGGVITMALPVVWWRAWYLVRKEGRRLQAKTNELPQVAQPAYSPVPPELSSQ